MSEERQTTRYEKAAEAFDISKEDQADALVKLSKLGFSPDSPVGVEAAIAFYLDKIAERLPRAIETAAGKATKKVTDAADMAVQGAALRIEEREADTVARISENIAKASDAALTRRVRVFDRNTLAAIVIASVALTGAVGGAGYVLGHSRHVETTEELQAAVQRGDGAIWLDLMQWNDIRGSLARYCGGASKNVMTLDNGRKACSVPLWLEGQGLAPDALSLPHNWTRVYISALDWLRQFDAWALLLAGFGLATIGRKLVRKFCSLSIVRWTFDIREAYEPKFDE